MKGLGGLRHTLKGPPNMGWRNASFRGFADYMQAEEFEENLAKLIEAAEKRATVIMCAEAVPWRCHRSLIGDALLIRGIQVRHIMSASSSREHTLTQWAKVKGTKMTYLPELIANERALSSLPADFLLELNKKKGRFMHPSLAGTWHLPFFIRSTCFLNS